MSIVLQFTLKSAFWLVFLVVITTLGTASGSSSRLVKRHAGVQVITSCTEPNVAALTFDGGPSQYLRDVADALTAVGGKGTFFFNGHNYVNIYDSGPASNVQYAYKQGHQIASITWRYLHLNLLSRDQIVEEFQKVDDAIQQIAGVKPAFMRPPYGEYNDIVLSVAGEREQNIVLWDVDSEDVHDAPLEETNNRFDDLVKRHPSNALVLMHDFKETTAHNVVPHAIHALSSAGYRLVTVAECVGLPPYQ